MKAARVNFALSSDEHTKLKIHAAKHGRSISDVLREHIEAVTTKAAASNQSTAPALQVSRPRIDGRSQRRSLRTIQFATRVSPEFDERIRKIAERDGLLLVEVLEKALDGYEKGSAMPEPEQKPKDSIASRLQIAMQEHGISQGDLSAVSGIARPNISQYLSGKKNIGLKTLQRMLPAFPGADVHWLISGDSRLI